MALRVVRLGTPRGRSEGLRIGTVRRPPRGVPKKDFARRGFYDVWLPELSPSEALVRRARQARDEREWRVFVRKYRSEMKRPEPSHLLDLLAALSHVADLSVGCYCLDARYCHRSVLRELLEARGARMAPGRP